jgi:hypothetical protein
MKQTRARSKHILLLLLLLSLRVVPHVYWPWPPLHIYEQVGVRREMSTVF